MEKLIRFKWPLFFLVAGAAFSVGSIFSFISLFRTSGTSFFGPGESMVTISKPGDYTLWQKTKTVIDGQFLTFPEKLPSGTTIKVFKQPDGTAVPWEEASGATMESGGTKRVSVAHLKFDTA